MKSKVPEPAPKKSELVVNEDPKKYNKTHGRAGIRNTNSRRTNARKVPKRKFLLIMFTLFSTNFNPKNIL